MGTNDATRPDITFSGNTPYVTWRSQVAGNQVAFTGHFVNAASPTFVLDSSNVPLTPTAQADVREPISSSCIANPFNADGAACQGGAIGTPFFLYTNGTAPRALFAQALRRRHADDRAGDGRDDHDRDPDRDRRPARAAPAKVSFQFGTTTAYGQTTRSDPDRPGERGGVLPGAADRASAVDHVPLPGGRDDRFRRQAGSRSDAHDRGRPGTTPPPPPADTKPPAIKVKIAAIKLGKLIRSGTLKVTTSLSEAGSVRASATIKVKVKRKRIAVGIIKVVAATFTRGGSKTLSLTLNRTGKSILRQLRKATITVTIRAVDTAGNKSSKTITTTVKRH